MRLSRRIALSAIIVLAFGAFQGCSKKDDIDIVKNGHLQLDKSVTIGKALDGYQYFETKNWQTVKTEQGARLVIFKADLNPQFVKEANELCSKSNPQQKKMESQKWSIQFTVNDDGTVHISGTQRLLVFDDKTKKGGPLNESLMQSVFKNQLAADCK